ncbi:PqqD family protein [Bacillus cereus]|uniref:PqqD family protein n=1 Tax=Bacillus cereus HuA2-1 TaxID=1053201 RepID=J9B5Y1_BACCE|nr:PqqD family protein [Bacillus cereus]EJV74119.1 hypothetical protein IG3_05941 [Bacillus cereus HuA2-1]
MKQIYKKDLNFRTRTISHKKILIGNSKAFELNDTGYIIWENIDGRTDVQELIKLLVDEYNCSVDEIESDIINFLSFLNSISAIKAVV